ncbi:endolytic transglycosylase MltG [Gilvimarinus sp. SDUM040013]|uniref:Endolytic murein transglycosylase n=1 Tax=Gilvimarinus gilvus TaxID=3058038 RepID=A0ABU4RWT0_9GAMM|nr:endolytic transglycosylase MltG [Gilvimarinus sp. SDUM040013]MDO3385716.1 endolytic transglycosylase MltG [Gilvimarinus sp. SDUM040013]MDX6849355.1 endolytic transglycosylase MltG [Gilvimarinus sp. SDUM040013]
MGRVALSLLRKFLLLGALAGAAAAFGAYQYFTQWFHAPMAIGPSELTYELKRGGSLSGAVTDLSAKQVLSHPRILLYVAKVTGRSAVKAGEYKIVSGTTPAQLLELLHRGDVVEHSITLIEGWTFAQAIAALSEAPKLKPLLQGEDLNTQLSMLDLPIEHPEGWFFPDTYYYTAGTTDIEILHRAYRKMRDTLDELWQARALSLPYDSPYEALIMASIVERETGAAWERQKIAGVFVRRLNQGMRLQTDPTVIYGMGARYQGRISRADLRRPTPYNTYVIDGLPPTPIALPGREAIFASLHPEQGSEVYFVARGDGTHSFSTTLEEHNAAVRRYQLQRSSDYRSTPPPERSTQ